MMDYLTFSYNGPPFVHFSPSHLAALGCTLAACVLIWALLRRGGAPRQREGLRYGLALFSLLNGIVWQLWNVWMGIWSPAYTLPVHICTLSNFLCAALLLWPSYRLYEVLYFWGWAGVTQAMLTPDIGSFGFPHFVFIIFFTSHGITLVCIVFATVAFGYRPTWASVGRATVITIVYLMLIGVINWLTGGNYMFVARKPDFPSLIDYLGPWPWYIPGLVGIGILSFVVCYLPFALRDWLRPHPT